MSFDEQPDGDQHGECSVEISRLESELAAERAAREKAEAKVARLREALREVVAFWDSITMMDSVNDLHVKARAALKDTDG